MDSIIFNILIIYIYINFIILKIFEDNKINV